ncbi:MAG: MiaB/RimO family radical SAM methylthiotransferase [Gemmatimonadetes bacterium]|nr:MiaB/RimO family radical SAM methylthiotransferase [Gemmatimonadota bacterium]NNM04774.1 MiaB/RimO family radical SAM methylthiotransferase [Gemmatimonadota bacterium]
MRVLFRTFGCKANQYDTERMRQELEAMGSRTVASVGETQLCVVNTCTVTNQADADARRFIRRVRRENPEIQVLVAGCSSALNPQTYREMDGVVAVVEGHDPVEVARAAMGSPEGVGCHPSGSGAAVSTLIPLKSNVALDLMHREPVGGELLRRRAGGTRGWLKIQDGCDRKCSFCATRLARGASRSRQPEELAAEAALLSQNHPELVLTGIHIGHYGIDLRDGLTLSSLVASLLEEVPDVRFRLGSVEATEVDALLLELMETSGGRLAPHLHMPMQSGSDAVLGDMRRWHTRGMYRERTLEIVERFPVLGLGADVISGFPGESTGDHDLTRALVEELPFTYLHVFPFSPRKGTSAEALPGPVPQRVAGERARELRELALEKGRSYRSGRSGQMAEVVLEGEGGWALTEDYLRVRADPGQIPEGDRPPRLYRGRLQGEGEHLYIDLSQDPLN